MENRVMEVEIFMVVVILRGYFLIEEVKVVMG